MRSIDSNVNADFFSCRLDDGFELCSRCPDEEERGPSVERAGEGGVEVGGAADCGRHLYSRLAPSGALGDGGCGGSLVAGIWVGCELDMMNVRHIDVGV